MDKERVEENISIRKWLSDYTNGLYAPNKTLTGENAYLDVYEKMCDAGWIDWFCNINELVEKNKRIFNIVKQVTNELILDEFFIFFENHCPHEGDLYDVICFEPFDDNKKSKMRFYIEINCPYNTKTYAIINRKCGLSNRLFETDDENELVNRINTMRFEDLGNNFEDIISERISIRNWIQNFEKDTYNTDIYDYNMLKNMIAAGWINWACLLHDLGQITKQIYKIIKNITNDLLLDNYCFKLLNRSYGDGVIYNYIYFTPIDKDRAESIIFILEIDFENNKYVLMRENGESKVRLEINDINEVIQNINSIF